MHWREYNLQHSPFFDLQLFAWPLGHNIKNLNIICVFASIFDWRAKTLRQTFNFYALTHLDKGCRDSKFVLLAKLKSLPGFADICTRDQPLSLLVLCILRTATLLMTTSWSWHYSGWAGQLMLVFSKWVVAIEGLFLTMYIF